MNEESNSEEELRINNLIKKLKIQLETGEEFFSPEGGDLPPKVEAQFLDDIIAFNEGFKIVEIKPMRDALGNPALIPEQELTDEQIHLALINFHKLLKDNNINFMTWFETPEREIYKFLSTEFLSIRFDKVNIPSWIYNYYYEDYVPNNEGEITANSEEILRAIFEQDYESFEVDFAQNIQHKGMILTLEKYIEIIKLMHEERYLEIMKFTLLDIEIDSDLEDAVATIEIKYSSKFLNEKEIILEDKVTVHFIQSFSSCWIADKVTIPSLGL